MQDAAVWRQICGDVRLELGGGLQTYGAFDEVARHLTGTLLVVCRAVWKRMDEILRIIAAPTDIGTSVVPNFGLMTGRWLKGRIAERHWSVGSRLSLNERRRDGRKCFGQQKRTRWFVWMAFSSTFPT